MASENFTIIRPVTLTDAMLTSSNVAEPTGGVDPTAWNPLTAYTVDQKVSYATTHMVYRRKVNGTTATAPNLDTTNWEAIYPTNRWAMFDAANSSQTSNAGSIVVTLTPGQVVDSVALDNLDADSVRVQVAGTSYDQTIQLKTRVVRNWWDYFVEPFEYKTAAVFTGLPPLTTNVITVTITKGTGDAKCGTCIVGLSKIIGLTQYGASLSIRDYSVKDTDVWGNTTFVERPYNKRRSMTIVIEKERVSEIDRLLSRYRATPIVYVGAGNLYESLIVYGKYNNFDIVISYHSHSECSIEVESI